ncbi:cytochrome P450 [Amycolatopsis pithecellobii]|uniref:Cytochrome P450 n=1 Tax=Amycolatopsis pithecellobii TaxID=664692 RepID=A0A6N7YM64_9PSEU|nr:cytochrome P450 [Amycolatopsis pithecellobii]MTD54047.1 cytochrome P450 [Amycolatopsis pithecellobii]
MNRTELQLMFRTLPFLDAHADEASGLVQVRASPEQRFLIWHPRWIEAVFGNDQRFRHPGSRSFRPLLGQRSLLWQEDSRHAAYRRVLGAPLRGRQLESYRGIIADATNAAIDALPVGTEFSVADWTRELTLRIMATITLGRADADIVGPYGQWIQHALGSRTRMLIHRSLRGGLPTPDARLEELLIHRARSIATENEDALSTHLLGSAEFADLDDGELKDQLVSLLFAGHETSASALAWTLYWLHRYGTIRERVQDDLDRTNDDGFTAGEMPFLQAVISESLRLTPPVPEAGKRMLTTACTLGGRRFAPRAMLTPNIYAAHRRHASFPHARTFDPDRFYDPVRRAVRRLPSHQFFPFGGGKRYCLGSQLAMTEVRMITVALLRRCSFRVVNPRAGRAHLRGHTVAPSPRLRMKVVVNRH